ncbi:MAG TPA: DUF2528 family protein [Pseudoxanthomonas sp.]
MSKKRYVIDHSEIFDIQVALEVDHDLLTPELASEINGFFIDADDRLEDADEDPVLAVIKLAASIFLSYVLDVNQSLNTEGMQHAFDTQYEGWPDAGKHGIKLIDWEGRPDLDSALLIIEEVA